MTRTDLLAARSHAELAALVAQLRGAALNLALDEAGLSHRRGGTVAVKRTALADHYGARLDSLALSRLR